MRYFRLRPFDQTTDQGRADERLRRVAWASTANLVSKGIAMLLMVASVHLTIGYLGPERFGVWMTLLSFVAMLSFLDLGVGNALTNMTASRAAGTDSAPLRQTISAGLSLLALLGAAMILVLLAGVEALPWGRLLRSEDPKLLAEAEGAGRVFAVGFGALVLTGGVQKVLLGLQQATLSHIASAVAGLVTIAALFVASRDHAPVPVLLGLTMAGQALGAVPLIYWLWSRKFYHPHVSWVAIRIEAPLILRTGSLFLALQIGTMIGWGADMAIISSTLGASLAAHYAVAQRLFQFASVPLAVINQPLWGAYADAHARNDRAFIRRTLIRSLTMTGVVAAAAAAVLGLAHGPLVHHWTQGTIDLQSGFVVTFGIWAVIEALATAAAMYMNGCAIIRPQLWAVLTFCILSIPLKFWLAGTLGLAGVMISTIVSWLIAVPLLYALFFRGPVTEPARIT